MLRVQLPRLLAVLLFAAASPAFGQSLFDTPGLGFQGGKVPGTSSIQQPAVRSFNANQCRALMGTCPLGRLQQSGTRCYCRSAAGTVRQGTAQKRLYGR